jgi:hypothetical protein
MGGNGLLHAVRNFFFIDLDAAPLIVLAFPFASGSKSSDEASLLTVELWIVSPNIFLILFFIDDEAVFT